MASGAWHGFNQYMESGRIKLCVGSAGYGDGGQQRDFVHVDDIVNANLWFLEHPEVSGIYNCGTGRAQTFNDVATAVANGVPQSRGEARLALAELVRAGTGEYTAFPPDPAGEDQSLTRASLARARGAGRVRRVGRPAGRAGCGRARPGAKGRDERETKYPQRRTIHGGERLDRQPKGHVLLPNDGYPRARSIVSEIKERGFEAVREWAVGHLPRGCQVRSCDSGPPRSLHVMWPWCRVGADTFAG
mgnify:CR=1 FL=1